MHMYKKYSRYLAIKKTSKGVHQGIWTNSNILPAPKRKKVQKKLLTMHCRFSVPLNTLQFGVHLGIWTN